MIDELKKFLIREIERNTKEYERYRQMPMAEEKIAMYFGAAQALEETIEWMEEYELLKRR